MHRILKYDGAVNPEDDILVKGYKILRLVRFQLSQTWNWEIRSHSFEFMLSPKLVDRAHIWVLLFRLWNLKKFKFGALCLLHPVLCCHFQASHHPFSHCRDGSSLRRVVCQTVGFQTAFLTMYCSSRAPCLHLKSLFT